MKFKKENHMFNNKNDLTNSLTKLYQLRADARDVEVTFIEAFDRLLDTVYAELDVELYGWHFDDVDSGEVGDIERVLTFEEIAANNGVIDMRHVIVNTNQRVDKTSVVINGKTWKLSERMPVCWLTFPLDRVALEVNDGRKKFLENKKMNKKKSVKRSTLSDAKKLRSVMAKLTDDERKFIERMLER